MPEKLVEVIRSELVESIHAGSIVVAASNGNVIYQLGDSGRVTYFHSSAKPIQGIAMLEAGIAEKFRLDLKEIALLISSHSGEKEHIEVLKSIMEKIGVDDEILECGIAEPVNKDVLKELLSAGLSVTKLHTNCSGKHLGFIAASKVMGYPLEGYYRADHPMQRTVAKIIAEFSGAKPDIITNGIDGCSVPVFAMPLRNMAISFANLCNPGFRGGKYSKSQNYITSAMTMYPEMIAGKGRIDTELMKRCGSRVIGKIGAEGVYCAGILGKGMGATIKIEDGSARAVGPVIMELLLQMKVITEDEAECMKGFWNPPVLNNKGEVIGEIKPVFKLKH
ncbi:MAG: asparaginase [Ruminiclostridium sp.]|nr:asparaginase [Ruminiclostridium sp.]